MGEVYPTDFCRKKIISLLDRILKERQTYSAKRVNTLFSRAMEIYKGGYRNIILEEKIIDAADDLGDWYMYRNRDT